MFKLRSFWKYAAILALLVLRLGMAAGAAEAENFLVQVWDTDAGLPDSTVVSLAQTPDSYLWVGTKNGGLARFDGQRFVNFNPGNTPELRSIQIQKLLVDAQGTLWAGTPQGGLISYRNGRFHFERQGLAKLQYWLQSVLASTSNSVVLATRSGWMFQGTERAGTNLWEMLQPSRGMHPVAMCGDGQGTIWYRTANGNLGRVRGSQFVRFRDPPGLRGLAVNTLLTDADGRLWVGTDKELARWDGVKFVDEMPTNGVPELNVQQLAACSDGSLWVRTTGGLRKWRAQQWVAQVTDGNGFDPAANGNLEGGTHGGLWVLRYGQGLWHVDANGQVTQITELPSTQFRCWFEDREGNLWIGLNGGGLVSVRARTFHQIWPTVTSLPVASSVCEDPAGTLWFGLAENRLLCWRDGNFSDVSLPIRPAQAFDVPVVSDAAGRLWIGSMNRGILRLEKGRFSQPFPAGNIVFVHVLFIDRADRLWIGTKNGLFCWDGKMLKSFKEVDGFSKADVRAVAEGPDGAVWIGTTLGELRCYRDGKFTTYRPPDSPLASSQAAADLESNPMAFSGQDRIGALHADAGGVIWIGSLGGGLLRFENGRFTRFAAREGLPEEQISQILEDDSGRLWLGTPGGIVQVSKAALNRFARGEADPLRFVTYGKSDGLPTVECSRGCQPACWHGRDGRLWFTTVKGAVWMDPGEVKFNPLPPPVLIEEVAVDGQRVGEDGQPAKRFAARVPLRLTLPPGRHYVDFKFTAPSLTAPDKVRFKWRLAGLEKDWGPESSLRTVNYNYLPPGNYEFQVRACNNDGVWNETGASLKITVQPHFWQTRLFPIEAALFLMVGTALVVGLGLRSRHRLWQARMEMLRATELERSRIARDLHDELGSGLTEVTMLTAAFPGANLTPEKLRERLQRVGARAHGLVDALDEIVWAVDPDKDNLSALAKYFAGHVEEFLQESNIACRVQMPVTFPARPVPAALRHQLFLAVREAVSNAVRHARPHQIGLAIALAGERELQITITDDGCGFDPAMVAAGNGLANLRTRLDSIGGDCEIVSQPGAGTTVKLVVALPDHI